MFLHESRDNRSSLSFAGQRRRDSVMYIPPSSFLSHSPSASASKVRELQCASSHGNLWTSATSKRYFFFLFHFQVKWNELTVYFIITTHSRNKKWKERDFRAMRPRDKRQHDVSPSRSFSFLNILFKKKCHFVFFFSVWVATVCAFTKLTQNLVPSIDKQVHSCERENFKFKEGLMQSGIVDLYQFTSFFFAIENHWLTFIRKR
jgi:hypothetical protein